MPSFLHLQNKAGNSSLQPPPQSIPSPFNFFNSVFQFQWCPISGLWNECRGVTNSIFSLNNELETEQRYLLPYPQNITYHSTPSRYSMTLVFWTSLRHAHVPLCLGHAAPFAQSSILLPFRGTNLICVSLFTSKIPLSLWSISYPHIESFPLFYVSV